MSAVPPPDAGSATAGPAPADPAIGNPVIGVIGLGHVGLPTALGLADLGWRVVGLDDDEARAERIAGGETPFFEPGLDALLREHLASGRFRVAADADAALREATVHFVCVGTPQREDGSADLAYIERAAAAIARNLDGYRLVVEKSTTPVRTAEWLREHIRRRAGPDAPPFDVAVNPEFLQEGSAVRDFFHPDRIVIGAGGERAAALLTRLYEPLSERLGRPASEIMLVTDINTAEIVKHASNAFLATKVSFVNMVSDLCEATGADVTDVAAGLGADPRIAPHFLRAGIGFGGYCLPKDIRAFERVASEHGVDFSLLREVDRINRRRVDLFVAKLEDALGPAAGRTVAVWGLSFKPGTDDVRHAPSLAIVERLAAAGARLRLHDPRAMDAFAARFPADPPALDYAATPEAAAEGADAAILLTEWDDYLAVNLEALRGRMASPLIVDGRNLFDPSAVRAAGFAYRGVGRP